MQPDDQSAQLGRANTAVPGSEQVRCCPTVAVCAWFGNGGFSAVAMIAVNFRLFGSDFICLHS